MEHCLIMKRPAGWHREMWREATPIGSGLLGGLVYGATAYETISINHSRLWHRGKRMDVPDIRGALERTRAAIDSGDYQNANWIITNALKENGFDAKLAMPCPLCDFNFDFGERKPFSRYRRILHMDRGEAEIIWNEKDASFRRKAFLSRKNDMLAVSMTAEGELICMTASVSYHDSGDIDTNAMLEKMQDSFKYETDGGFICFSAVNEDGVPFGAAARIITDGIIEKTEAEAPGSLKIIDASKILLLAKFFIDTNPEKSLSAIKGDLTEISDDYEQLLEEHRQLHEPLYASCGVTLCDSYTLSNEELLLDAYEGRASAELLDKLWHFGRYLMVCGTREDSNPFPLYGLWHGRYSMPWPHNMANENTQMTYWHALCGGMAHTIKPLIDYYLGMMDQFRNNAKNIFGLPGIYLPAGTTPGNGVPNQIVPVINNWIGCGGWLAQHFYDYYKFTGDKKELRERVLPFMLECARFYEAYLVMGDDGFYKVYPSVSPENTPSNLMPPKGEHMAHPCPSVVNATMDIAIIRELFTNLIEACDELGEYAAEIPGWRDIISSLPQYQKTDLGNIREWMYPGLEERYDHRHLSHIYPVFPGKEFVKGRDSDEILDAFELAVDMRKLGAQSGWSLSHMSCIYSRFGRAEKAAECLDNLTRACLSASLFSLHNDWRGMGLSLGRGSFAPVQLDAGMGAVNAIQEMLLFVSDGIVKILPALPERFPKGSISDLRFMTGRISFEWDMAEGMLHGTISAERDTNIIVKLPRFAGTVYVGDLKKEFRDGEKLILKAGEAVSFSAL